MNSRVLLATVCFFWASSLIAQSYTVQLGAFREPTPGFTDAAKDHGEVYEKENAKGLTIISVGRFSDRDSAEALLARMTRDYPDAYVRRLGRAGSRQAVQKAASPARSQTVDASPVQERAVRERPAKLATASANDGLSVAELRSGSGPILKSNNSRDKQLFQGLSYEDQERVVTLDGRLYIKLGEEFVPLTEYKR